MSLIDLSLRARELSSDLFKLFVNHFGSERFFDYHLLHRYASLFNVSLVDHEVYRQVLHRLVGREGRPQPRSVRVRVPKLGIPFPPLRTATIGAHSRTSKYILTKELNIFALSAQITGYSYKQKKYSDIRCPSELVADMRDIMKVHFGSAFESDLECDVGLDNFLKIVVQQTNYSVTIDESVFSAIKNQKLNYCVPRPADSFSKFIISNVPAESDIRYFGHNLAYSPIYEGDAVQNMFPPIKLQSLRYEDDIRSLKKAECWAL